MFKKSTLAVTAAVMALSLAACGTKANENTQGGATPAPSAATPAPAGLKGEIKIDGSSTVFPISQAVAEEFMKKNKDVKITVGESGSGNGAKKLIAGEIDIADMSRKFKKEELDELKTKQSTEAFEMPVALDGITVVVNKKNTFAKDMTAEELKKIWNKDSKLKKNGTKFVRNGRIKKSSCTAQVRLPVRSNSLRKRSTAKQKNPARTTRLPRTITYL